MFRARIESAPGGPRRRFLTGWLRLSSFWLGLSSGQRGNALRPQHGQPQHISVHGDQMNKLISAVTVATTGGVTDRSALPLACAAPSGWRRDAATTGLSSKTIKTLLAATAVAITTAIPALGAHVSEDQPVSVDEICRDPGLTANLGMTSICASTRLRAAFQTVSELNDRAWATLPQATMERLNEQRKAFDGDCGLERAHPATQAAENCYIQQRKQEATLIRR
jgi:hypothetical protein